mmetsp:Transcript_11941/g.28334  ORF Transcript_11941/g.28334 Transcript_11941/m.28334 type:complete len:432 (+) Transcript_11941:323-1618(+)|eukprot:CAMPEP_0197195052 /NCGR_PEP_ID=MMETSP1423-20130617/30357_1 /TAXON_ID=476441 /ORGANISM="Pseudo-nitzschia heimii, Strain UNC1101" /LENGTH=431 /DNA_ID=CAMNT_0042648589 /DNA_START=210 /DNA_END=1505 /DNA_ORIENTATION=-
MARTRKRDDDSQYNNSTNSDTTSLAALDASSMSATGSRSSLTFSSSNNRTQRPRKRQRKSLTDALQSISLDKDSGVPEQILKMGGFPFSKSCVAFTITSGKSTSLLSGTFGGHGSGAVLNENTNLNSQQQLHRQLDRSSISGDGDLYYDDDNSQLTSSTVEGEGGMEDNYDDEDDQNDDEEDSQRKRIAQMTDQETAQRKVMFELVFGKDHRESRKAAPFFDREVSACEARTPPVRIDEARSSSPPFASISTRTRSKKAKASNAHRQPSAAINSTATAASITKRSGAKDTGSFKDSTDRKIEELLRRSLKNIQEGCHPLQLKSTPDDDDSKLSSKWRHYTTQDDMMIDPQIYSPRMGASAMVNANATSKTASMSIEGTNNLRNSLQTTDSRGHIDRMLQTQAIHFGNRPRSNSLPTDLDKSTDSIAMDTDV